MTDIGEIFANAYTQGYNDGRKYALPEGGTVLTAEQWAHYQRMAADPRFTELSRDALGVMTWPENPLLPPALFPATVPAEEHCTVPPDGWWCSRTANHDGPCVAREVALWMPMPLEADWLDQVDPRDPQSRTHRETAAAKFAVPAEEETKAEALDLNALVGQVTQAAWIERKRTKEFYGYDSQDWDELPSSKQQIEYSAIRGALTELQRLGLLTLPVSSPVVPAPTETGPWPKWDREQMQQVERILRLVSYNWNFNPVFRDQARIAAESLAPFVAAEEASDAR